MSQNGPEGQEELHHKLGVRRNPASAESFQQASDIGKHGRHFAFRKIHHHPLGGDAERTTDVPEGILKRFQIGGIHAGNPDQLGMRGKRKEHRRHLIGHDREVQADKTDALIGHMDRLRCVAAGQIHIGLNARVLDQPAHGAVFCLYHKLVAQFHIRIGHAEIAALQAQFADNAVRIGDSGIGHQADSRFPGKKNRVCSGLSTEFSFSIHFYR